MPAPVPRTSRVETLLANVVNLKNLAITWVKETLPQKFAIFKFNAAEKNALKALQRAITSKNLSEKVEKFKEFLEFDHQLADIWEKESRMPSEMGSSYITKLSKIFREEKNFRALDELVGALYNICIYPYVKPKEFQELAPVHQSLCQFLKFHAKSGEHQKTIAIQSKYCKFKTCLNL